MKKPSSNRVAFTRREFADLFGVTPRTVANWVRDGHVRVVKVGAKTMIPAREVDRIISRPRPSGRHKHG